MGAAPEEARGISALDQLRRYLLQEPAGLIDLIGITPVEPPPPRVAQIKVLLGACQADVTKPPFFLDIIFGDRAAVWEQPFLAPGEEDHGEFEPFGVVQRHQRDFGVLIHLVDLRVQSGFVEELLPGFPAATLLAGNGDQFLNVEDAAAAFLGALFSQVLHVPAGFEDLLERHVQRGIDHVTATVDQIDERLEDSMRSSPETPILEDLADGVPGADRFFRSQTKDPAAGDLADAARRLIEDAR